MARKQVVAERAKSTKSPKMHNKSRRSKNIKQRITPKKEEVDEPEALIVPNSSSEEEEDADKVTVEEVNNYDGDNDVEEEEEAEEEVEDEDEVKIENVEEGESNDNKKKSKNKEKKKSMKNVNGGLTETSSSLWQFPMHRVSRILKSEDPNIRISQEAVYLINKASEKFLQLFSMEAFACAFLDRKKSVTYKHVSSVVKKRKRFDFLSDFVPERLKAEDALKEMPSTETS